MTYQAIPIKLMMDTIINCQRCKLKRAAYFVTFDAESNALVCNYCHDSLLGKRGTEVKIAAVGFSENVDQLRENRTTNVSAMQERDHSALGKRSFPDVVMHLSQKIKKIQNKQVTCHKKREK